jgi:hypothetical protein
VRAVALKELDTFRELASGESPAALSNLFGSEDGLILLPEQAAPELLEGYRGLAEAWVAGHPGWQVTTDAEVHRLPKDGAIWVLGWENRFAPEFARQARGFELVPQAGKLRLGVGAYGRSDASPVLTRVIDGQPWGWLAASQPEALPGLARKLPHYGKYGYLMFSGSEPQNILKGQWPAGDSALVHWFGQDRPELAAILEKPLVSSRDRPSGP